MSEPLSTFHASYSWSGGWGAHENIELLVIARDEEHARSQVALEYSETSPGRWTFTKIDNATPAVHFISSHSS